MGSEELISLARVDYPQAKELFAINVTGCSMWDILSTLLVVPLLCAIYQELCILLFSTHVSLCFVIITSSCIPSVQNGYYLVFTLYLNISYLLFPFFLCVLFGLRGSGLFVFWVSQDCFSMC